MSGTNPLPSLGGDWDLGGARLGPGNFFLKIYFYYFVYYYYFYFYFYLLFLFFIFIIYFKGGYTERRDREEYDALPKRAQRPMLCGSNVRSLFLVSHVGAGSQSFGRSSTVSLGTAGSCKGAGLLG